MIPKKYILSLLLAFGMIFGMLGSNAIADCNPCEDCEGYLGEIIEQVDMAIERIGIAEAKLTPPVSIIDRIRARASLRLAKIKIVKALIKCRRCSLSDCLVDDPPGPTDPLTIKEALKEGKKLINKAIRKIYVRKYTEAIVFLSDATMMLGSVIDTNPCPPPEGP